MVDVTHDTLLFIVYTLNSIYMFCFLQFLTKISIMSAHIFVLTTIAIELNIAIRNIGYRRTLNAKVYAHDIAFAVIDGFCYLIYDLSDYLVTLIDNAHSAESTVCKDGFLPISHFSFDRKPFGFAIYEHRELNAIAINLIILIIDITTGFSKNRNCGYNLDIFALFSKFGILAVSVTTSLIVFLNDRLGITNTLIC